MTEACPFMCKKRQSFSPSGELIPTADDHIHKKKALLSFCLRKCVAPNLCEDNLSPILDKRMAQEASTSTSQPTSTMSVLFPYCRAELTHSSCIVLAPVTHMDQSIMICARPSSVHEAMHTAMGPKHQLLDNTMEALCRSVQNLCIFDNWIIVGCHVLWA